MPLKFLPCPFCGSEEVTIHKTHKIEGFKPKELCPVAEQFIEVPLHFASCDQCTSSTSKALCAEGAIMIWNTRSGE